MNKHLIVIGIAVLLICVGLSGCFETSNDKSNGSELAEIIEYNMEEVRDSTDTYISVNGTIKNIAGRMLEAIVIYVNFYDSNNNQLGTKTDIIINLPNSYNKSFSVVYYDYESYYEKIDHVGFSFEEGTIR